MRTTLPLRRRGALALPFLVGRRRGRDARVLDLAAYRRARAAETRASADAGRKPEPPPEAA
jgi:hypothetical protein